jgi:hypothetical protein
MNTTTLAAGVVGFLLGGLTVSIAAELEDEPPPVSPHGAQVVVTR